MATPEQIPLVLRLADLLKIDREAPPDMELLPLCHTTKLEALRNMLIKQKLIAIDSYAEFQNEYLLFFFYGKARYIPSDDVKLVFDDTNPPIAFIFKIDNLPNPTRMLPFDSGGFHLYNINLDLDEFVIKPDSFEDVKKFIKQVYSKNKNYIKRKITIDPKKYPLCTPIEHLKILYDKLDTGPTSFGEQAYTMEIQYKEDLPLCPFAIVVPDVMVSSPQGRQQLELAFGINEKSECTIHAYDSKKELILKYNSLIEVVNKIVRKMASE